MRFVLIFCCLLQVLEAAPPRRRARAPRPTLAIRNVTVIDATGAQPLKAMTVVVSGTLSTAIQPAKIAVAKSIPVIDGSGKFLIPGLWDMHVHLWEKRSMFPLYVANGVTGVRDMGSDFERTNRLRDEAMAGKRIGPDVFTSGPPVDGGGGGESKVNIIRAMSPDDGRRAVDTLEDKQTDFIKILSTLSRDTYMALAQRARVLRAPFAGHLPEAVTVIDAVNNRQRSMEHLFGLMLACSSEESELREKRAAAIRDKNYDELRKIRDRTYETYSERKARNVFDLLRTFKVYQTPTLTLRRRMSFIELDKLTADANLKYIPADVRETWIDPAEQARNATPETLQDFRRDFDEHLRLTARMARAGVPILAGTDTGDSYVLPGFSLHDELELMVQFGMSPMEALQAATRNAVMYLGEDLRSGTIERGKQADLVLLDGNPLEDIRATRKIAAVVLRGKAYNKKALAEMLESAKKLE